MRILHTADWHLGARLGPHDRLGDQRRALAGVEAAAREAKPDLIVHAGDVWDTFHLSHDALHTGLMALTRLGALAPTIVVGGNHDVDLVNRVRALEVESRTAALVARGDPTSC